MIKDQPFGQALNVDDITVCGRRSHNQSYPQKLSTGSPGFT